jgi:hypothetical protein
MSEDKREQLLDLLLKKALHGLDDADQRELDGHDEDTTAELHLLEMTAAAINVAGTSTDDSLPAHLYSKILDDSRQYVGVEATEAASPWPPPMKPNSYKVEAEHSGSSWFGWLGWAAAAAACIALAFNLWITQTTSPNQANIKPTPEIPKSLTPAEMREEMMRSTAGMIKANWGPGTMKELTQVAGDVVWSDEKQVGYMRFRGLPVNDKAKETYQLWIFDKTQDKATPIDGGTFDVNSDGEIVIPINPKLKAKEPEMFAITLEKPGGVVVSKREKLAALAKVKNQTS